jgi:hypothetical protein
MLLQLTMLLSALLQVRQLERINDSVLTDPKLCWEANQLSSLL